MNIRRAHPPHRKDDRIRGAGAPRRFTLEPGPQRAQIQIVVENAGFGALYFVLRGDPPRSMFYVRALSLEDMAEMKEGIRFINYVDHHGDCGAYLRCLMTQLVTATEAPILSLNIKVSKEGREATFVEIQLVPGSKCLELPLPPTFTRADNLFGGSSSGFLNN
ncbi:hypothetical protein Cgig2_003123 [Carnegiea gigantea]|uniref:Uncharacterized protein n=1 Tax=Carnegiea gigantea TaxID=171969 RepID=A0A9Q1GR57_9CARY|nr:hypothetical protein Cgig2_003123 [Carnegiea gigantea]